MSITQVLEISRDLFYTAFLIALPSLAISLLVGLVISILQAITSVQEQTLTFVPRIVAVGAIVIFTMAWSMQLAVHFTIRMLVHAADVTQ